MATTSVRDIELILPGSFGKETLSNDAFESLSLGISGAVTIPLAGTDVTLTEGTTGQAQHFVQILTGTLTANVNVIVPAESRVYIADNRTLGSFTVTVKTASGGGIAVDQGARTLVYCDGVNVYPVASGTGGGGGSGAPTDATYLVQSAHSLLSGERAVTDTTTVTWDFATAGQAKAQIPDGALTYAKLQDVTPTRLLGRFTAGAGDVQEITPGTGLTLDASGVLSVVAGGGAQPADATLTALAGVTTGANTTLYFTGVDVAASTPLTPFARTLVDDPDQAAMQATLGVVPGTDVQPFDPTLAALAGVTTGADRLAFFTGTDTATTTVLTPFMRSLLDDPNQAAAQATLGVTPGGGAIPGGTSGQVQYNSAGSFGGSSALTLDATTLLTLAPLTTKGDLLVQGSTAPVRLPVGTNGQVLTADSVEVSGVKWAPLAAGVNTFLALSDTPDAYSGQGGKVVAVNSGATALEFITAGGTSEWTRVAGAAGSTASTGLLAFWRMEEASGNRLDSVASQALVPTGAPGSATGKTGQAVSFDTGTGKYLSIPDSPTLSVGTNQDFTVACWVRFNGTPSGSRGLVGKGNASIAYSNCEYLLGTSGTALQWYIGNGSGSVNLNAGVTLAASTWYLVIGWYDAAADLQYVQVNNATPVSIANANGSYDSTGPVEVGRQPQWSGSAAFDGLVDNVMFWKRTLTTQERTDLWNSGNGLDYADLFPAPATLHPATSTDRVLAGGTTLTATEPLESAGGVKLGTSTGIVDGVMRWTGSDFEGRKAGAWVSLTGPPLPLDIADGGTGATTAPAARTALGLGTMSTQDANNVNITDGRMSVGGHAPTGVLDVQGSVGSSDIANWYFGPRIWPVAPGGAVGAEGIRIEAATGAALATISFRGVDITNQPTIAAVNALYLDISAGPGRYNVSANGTAQNYFAGNVGIANNAPSYPLDVTGTARVTSAMVLGAITPAFGARAEISYGTMAAFVFRPTTDSSPYACYFTNVAATNVGSIITSATATAYNTSSDVRLKHRIEKLVGALGKIQLLNPVSFLWNANDSPGEGFLAHELQQIIPAAVTGEPAAINDDGSIRPQQVDHSKLVPWLVSAMKELAARVEYLETQLGV